MNRFMIPVVLALFIVSGCEAEPQADSAESPPAEEISSAPAAETGGASAEEYLPEVADDGSLPRTLAGYTLLDPVPADSTHEGGMFFKGSVFREDIVRTKPRATVRPYSLDDAIFRIEYSDDAPPPWDEVVRVGLDRYGEPYQQEDNEVVWIRDGSTLSMRNYQESGGGWIAIEDEKGALNAYNRSRELEQSE